MIKCGIYIIELVQLNWCMQKQGRKEQRMEQLGVRKNVDSNEKASGNG